MPSGTILKVVQKVPFLFLSWNSILTTVLAIALNSGKTNIRKNPLIEWSADGLLSSEPF